MPECLNSISAEQLNQNAHCIRADFKAVPNQYKQSVKDASAQHPLFISEADIRIINDATKLLTKLSHNKEFQSLAYSLTPEIVRHDTKASGVLFGYDFHLTDDGPKLIEINTNAGAIFLNNFLNQSQAACCDPIAALMKHPIPTDEGLEKRLITMFLQEFQAQHPNKALHHLAIVDEAPESQFLYPEFLMFKALFERHGIKVSILDPNALEYNGSALTHQGEKIDFVYNRHTDFYLENEASAPLKSAYLNEHIVLSPNPRAYGLSADKRLLSVLSDTQTLEKLNLSKHEKMLLDQVIPKTIKVTTDKADLLWKNRRKYFFKPGTGYGSKAVYRGAKLTKKVWLETILTGNYIAQEFVPPKTKTLVHEGQEQAYKFDIRNYAYQGESLLIAARLYQGQTTNLRTPGGGFATVYSSAH